MQEEILEAMPEAGLRIYAIYFEMVEGDRGAKSRVKPADLFTDPRVTVFWDEGKVAGRWFDEHVTKLGAREGAPGRIEWDAFVLYGPEARWSGESSEHVSWGRPLAQEAGRLKMDLDGVI